MKDLLTRADIELMVVTFYDKVKKDDVIGFIFNDIAAVDWQHHLPIMFNFWETTVLGTGNYSGNAMRPHYVLNKIIPLTPQHFHRWLELFNATADILFEGENAELMKTKAKNIAALMQYKMEEENGLRIV